MGVQVLPGAPDPAGGANKRIYLIMDNEGYEELA